MTKVSVEHKKAIAKSIDEVEAQLSDSLLPKNNRYQYALNFEYKNKQELLQNYLDSADFKIRQSEWAKLALVEYLDAFPEEG